MSDLGALSYYLGIEVRQGKEALTLGQRAYASKLLERSDMAECKPCVTPMEEQLKPMKASTTTKVDTTLLEHRRRSMLPSPHEARHCVRRGLRQPFHGGSLRGSLGCGEVATMLHQGDGRLGDRLPQDRWK